MTTQDLTKTRHYKTETPSVVRKVITRLESLTVCDITRDPLRTTTVFTNTYHHITEQGKQGEPLAYTFFLSF